MRKEGLFVVNSQILVKSAQKQLPLIGSIYYSNVLYFAWWFELVVMDSIVFQYVRLGLGLVLVEPGDTNPSPTWSSVHTMACLYELFEEIHDE